MMGRDGGSDSRLDECLELEPEPELIAAVRAWLRDLLEAWEMPEQADEALLVASELVSNAVLHARTTIQLRVACSDSTVRVEVYDENSRLPTLAPCPADATSGRGLSLVASLSSGWGIESRDDGKVVWATLGTAPADRAQDCLDLTDARNVDEALDQVTRLDRDREFH